MTEKEIQKTLEDYARAYCAKDIDALMQVFDDTDNISVIGTGANELCVGQEAIRELFLRNFRDASAKHFEWGWIDTRISGKQAVVSVKFTLHLEYEGKELKVSLRWTVVLRDEGNRWVWVHRHASTAAENQEEGQAYPKESEK
jgi:ketosteroid isomerase-like protein